MNYKMAVKIPTSQVSKLKEAGIKIPASNLYIVDGEPTLFMFTEYKVFPQWWRANQCCLRCKVQFAKRAQLYYFRSTSIGLGPFVNSSNGKVIKISPSPSRGAENWKFVEGAWRYNGAKKAPA